jgi:hypothetical protein
VLPNATPRLSPVSKPELFPSTALPERDNFVWMASMTMVPSDLGDLSAVPVAGPGQKFCIIGLPN